MLFLSAAGFFQLYAGRSKCEQCQPGTYNNGTGKERCDLCTAGYYQNETQALQCKPCEIGTYESGMGKARCSYCPAGTFRAEMAAITCTSWSATRHACTHMHALALMTAAVAAMLQSENRACA